MRCVTPMFRRFEKGNHSKGIVVARSEVLQTLDYDPNYIRHCLNEINSKSPYYGYEQIPCQKCWACQLNYSAEWATRIMLEAKKSEYNFFITLTYDDEHLPILEDIQGKDKNTGVHVLYKNDGTWTTGSLLPEDMDTFLNSLRKHFERKNIKGIKYFYCGEYGETTNRPHYHIILLNCPLDIYEFYDTHIDTNYKAHWKSKEVERYWKKGMIDIAELEWSCAAYVARYCTKKISLDPNKDCYYEKGQLPEYVRMSKGIGFEYYLEHKHEIYKNDEMIMKTVKGNTGSFKPPKAFDRMFQQSDPEAFKLIKESRKHAKERSDKLIREITDYTDKEMNLINADKLQTKMSMLPRVGEW